MKQKGLRIAAVILLAAALLANLYVMTTMQPIWQVHVWSAAKLLACIYAALYIIDGCTKESGPYFKGFAVLYAVQAAARVLVMIASGNAVPCMAGACVAVVIALILAFVKDLGKKKSKWLMAVLLLIEVIYLVMLLVGHGVTVMCTNGVLLIILAFIYYVMIAEKYIDKDARGTK